MRLNKCFALVAGCALSVATLFAGEVAEKKPYKGLLLEMTGDEKRPVSVWNSTGTPVLDPFYDFDRKGLALVGREYSLQLEGGRFFSGAAEEYLGDGLKGSDGELSITAYVVPSSLPQTSAGCLVGYGPSSNQLLFALTQEKDELSFSIGAPEAKKIKLVTLKNRDPFHVVVTVTKKEIVCYINGDKAGGGAGIEADFSKWGKGMMFFGNDGGGKAPWRGQLERVALYNKALDAAEAKKVAAALQEEFASRIKIPRIEIEGTLAVRSTYTMPWAEGFTYREVLSICEYKVNKVISGEFKGEKMRVAEWMYVDRIFLTNSARKPGTTRRLVVEPLDVNPQLSTTQRDDTLDLDMDAVVYYDLSPLEALPADQQPKPAKK